MREHLIFDNCETTEEIDALLLQTVQFIKKKYEHADQQRQQGYIDEVERLIEKNYQNCDYGVLQIATDLNLSNTYISKLYKDLTGTNIIERLTQYRMKAAVSLLLETDIPVTDIYSLAGYSSVNYFYRVFKKYYGVTPGQYRDMKGDSQ
jgi:AraC-like DNA-binding protein